MVQVCALRVSASSRAGRYACKFCVQKLSTVMPALTPHPASVRFTGIIKVIAVPKT